MIVSFRDRDTEAVAAGEPVRRFRSIQMQAQRKLYQMHLAERITDLNLPPGNRLEKLKGNRSGQWSIRINDQWRICFEWREDGAYDVEIVDYH
ncbi:MAG TPA: type II toxin-antitoxin system RelE/ParE family toxin [bacterium]